MGKAIGGAFKAITGGLGNIGATVIKAVAPKAIDLLKNVVGSGFDKLANIAKSAVGSLPLVGPLASGLIDKLAPGLKNLATGGVESLLTKLANSITERLALGTGGQNLSLPGILQRLPEILNQATSAATTSSSSAASTSGSSSTSTGASVGTNTPPNANDKKYKRDADGNMTNEALQSFQQDFQKYMDARNMIQEMAKRASDISKAQHDAIMGLMQNIK